VIKFSENNTISKGKDKTAIPLLESIGGVPISLSMAVEPVGG